MFKRWSHLAPLLLAGALLVGCALPGGNNANNASPPPAGSGASNGCLARAPAPPAGARKVTVQRVVDGDTIELADGTKVRFIGINTPESVDPRRPVQAYGKEASNYAKALLEGKEIWLLEGRTPRDQYGRTLAWLWLPDGRFLNAMLVQDGYAQVYTFKDNPDNADLLLACQSEARAANRGLWALPEYHDGEQASKMDRQPVGSNNDKAPATGGPAAGAPGTGAGSVTVTQAPGTVARKATAHLAVKTDPGAHCTIEVRFKSGPSKAQGLEPKAADAAGAAAWSWTIGSSTAVGTWPVVVTCGSASAETSITIQ